MESEPSPKIVGVARMQDGIIVEFDDDTAVLYSTDLLCSILQTAVKIVNIDEDSRERP